MFDSLVVIFGRFGLLLSLLFSAVALLFAALSQLLRLPLLFVFFPAPGLCARGKGELAHEHSEEGRENGGEALYGVLWALAANGEIGRAEDLLFAQLDLNDKNSLALAVEFYQKLNRMTDEELEAGGFSREEVWEGLREVTKRFGLYLSGHIS